MPKTSAIRAVRAARPRPRNAGETRARILAAARVRFSHNSYENVGTRDIAADAGVDAALVNRYFGSKEGLFVEAIEGGFRLEDRLPASLDDLGAHLVRQVMGGDGAAAGGFDALRLLLRASGSPEIAALTSERFHAEFVGPLARLLCGRDAERRAELIASYVIGLATMRHVLRSPALAGARGCEAAAAVGAAIQACVE